MMQLGQVGISHSLLTALQTVSSQIVFRFFSVIRGASNSFSSATPVTSLMHLSATTRILISICIFASSY